MSEPAPPRSRFLRALRGLPVDRTPVWFMRQAGRSLPEYRRLRERHEIPEILRDPRLAADVTVMPLEHYPVDAAVLFMDLSTPFEGAGLEVAFREGVGPVVDRPLRSAGDVHRLRPFDPADSLRFVLDAIREVKQRIDIPLIGFIGAPFTLSSYLFEGSRRRRVEAVKRLMWTEAAAWETLAGYWTEHLAAFAVAQRDAGADAIQLFDSWAGELGPEAYRRDVLPHSARLLARLEEAGIPTVHFATGNPRLLPLLARAGGDAIGVDWRVPLDEAWATVGHDRAVQGNLDPAALLAGREVAVREARRVLRRAAGRPGHIFNLGHGILPDTPTEVVRAVVDAVHAFEARPAGVADGASAGDDPGGGT